MKYYAVVVGKSGRSMILNTWEECQKEVIGCKGAIFKSFRSKDEAIKYIRNHNIKYEDVETPKKKSNNNTNIINDFQIPVDNVDLATSNKDEIRIYIDGSYMDDIKNYSYGLVVVKNDEILYKENGKGNNPNYICVRNVAGEIQGAINAVKYAIKNKINDFIICYDYKGVELWATGGWKRNKDITIAYHNFMQKHMLDLNIKFEKIKSHSGNKYNELADQLAKQALIDDNIDDFFI